MVLESPNLRPYWSRLWLASRVLDATDKGGKAALHLDDGRTRLESLGIQIGQYQPGFGAEGQAERDPFVSFRIPSRPRFNTQGNRSLFPLPFAHLRAGVAVGH